MTSVLIVEDDPDDYQIPTVGVLVGDDFYYIANSQSRSFRTPGRHFCNAMTELFVHGGLDLKTAQDGAFYDGTPFALLGFDACAVMRLTLEPEGPWSSTRDTFSHVLTHSFR